MKGPFTTKEFLKKVNVSEATLRRWLAEGRIPALEDVERDWKGHRKWEDRHIRAVEDYKRAKFQQVVRSKR